MNQERNRTHGNWWLHRPSNNNQHQQTALLNRCIATGKANSDRHRRTGMKVSGEASSFRHIRSNMPHVEMLPESTKLRSNATTKRPSSTDFRVLNNICCVHPQWNRDSLFDESALFHCLVNTNHYSYTVGTMDSMPWCQFGLPWWTKSVVLRCNLRCCNFMKCFLARSDGYGDDSWK
jgi:hypothetical protein